MTNEDILAMTAAELSEEVILTAIRTRRPAFDLGPDGLIALRDGGVSEGVVAAMLERSAPPESASRPSPATPSEMPSAMTAPPSEVVIRDGTVLRLLLAEGLTSGTAQEGDAVYFRVAEDVYVDGVCVIESGASARGSITFAKKRRSFGRRGKLDFTIDYVEAVNGEKLPLRTAQRLRGDGKYATAGVVTYLTGPFGALVKGKNVEIDTGTEYTVFIHGDRRMRLVPPVRPAATTASF